MSATNFPTRVHLKDMDSINQARDLCRDAKPQEALLVLDAARKHAPSPAILIEMAHILVEMNLLQPAQSVLEQGLRQFPDDAGMVIANANYWYKQNNPKQGLSLTTRIIQSSAHPADDLLLTHAHLLKADDQVEEARAMYQKILTRNQQHAAALSSLGGIELDRRNYKAALDYYRSALKQEPTNAHIETQLAYTEFRCGDLKTGWKHYYARFGNPSAKGIVERRVHPFPMWNGNALPKGKLLVWGEQAIGEEVLYSTMLSDAQKLCPDGIIVECDKRLKPLFERSFHGIHFVARDVPDIALADKAIMAQCPAGQLGQFFRTSFDEFPKQPLPLRADATRAQQLRDKYEDEKQRLGKTGRIIGISWKSKPLRQGDPKSSTFADWQIIFEHSPHLFVSLQYGDIADDIALAKQHGWPLIVDGDVQQHQSLDEFAAQISAVDHVISVSNTTAHMAGAIAKPCTLLLPYSRGLMWHWFDKSAPDSDTRIATSPWYPSLHLLRQTKDGAWDDVLNTAKAELNTI